MTTDAELADRRARWLGPMKDLDDAGLKREVSEAYSKLAQELESLSRTSRPCGSRDDRSGPRRRSATTSR